MRAFFSLNTGCFAVYDFSYFVPYVCQFNGTVKRATENVKLVLRLCCKTKRRVMLRVLRFYQPPKQTLQLYLLQDRFERGWLNTQYRYSTRFAAMLHAKQVARRCLFYRTLSP